MIMILVFKINKGDMKVPNHTTSSPNTTVSFGISLKQYFTVQIQMRTRWK